MVVKGKVMLALELLLLRNQDEYQVGLIVTEAQYL
jgi:hypothetical protein